ncbi:anti-sigma factor [Sphingomonas sp. LB-2]|uniref:anti-sigma factor n=1 Tax=Sphingomonas caeni TaxID=2984949 RepID=UPI002231D22D|nr:anti-sigma factor [Sphingomonas caeni]MCW3847486.1 anti-sigma factor [Sphingomonas caeni]
MDEAFTPEQERDLLAAELALGVLEGADRAAALRLRLAEPDFAVAVTAWERRFDPLYEEFAEAAPPNVWPAVERRLGALRGDAVRALRRWRIAAIGSGAIAASLAGILVLRPPPAPVQVARMPDQLMVTQLEGGEGPEQGIMLAANYDPAEGELRIRAMKVPAGNLEPELWVIPADGVPRSLGMVARGGLSRMKVPMAQREMIQDGATLAITMEPRDGAPHKAPSSAPIAAGKISTI